MDIPFATPHAEQRWHERATAPDIGPVAAWTDAEQLVGHGLDAHEARYHHESETVLLRKNDYLVTVLNATTPRASVARALDRLGYGGEQA